MLKPDWIGILVSRPLLSAITKGKKTFEQERFYEEACLKYNLKPGYFCLKDIRALKGKVSAYFHVDQHWEQELVPLPKVIHNRMRLGPTQARKLKFLEEHKITVFNLCSVYGKLYINQLLKERSDFHPFLPLTHPFSPSAIQDFSGRFSSFLLKPNKGSLGSGIKKVDRLSDLLWEISYRKNRRIVKEVVNNHLLPIKVMRLLGKQTYLIQETIDLARYKGATFDIRVSVQKGMEGDWNITGMVAKVARVGHFLSNVAKGGTCFPLEEIFRELPHLNFKEVKVELEEVAISFAQYLEEYLPNLADVGFDFGIDKSGHPYFIEMNLRDQRYSFAEGRMIDTWKRTYENPIAYASYLLNGKEGC